MKRKERKYLKIIHLIFCLSLMNGMIAQSLIAAEPEPSSKKPSEYNALLYKLLKGAPLPKASFELPDPSLNVLIDYTQYGELQNLGTTEYRYVVKKGALLQEIVGEGLYPNQSRFMKNAEYQRLKKEGLLEGSHWDFVNMDDHQRAFFRWTQAHEEGGVKLFFTALILEKAGHIIPAIKAYYAALIHFPRSACWAADGSYVWYIAPVCIASIQRLCRDYPQLSLALVDAAVDIQNGNDTNLKNDIIAVNPGKIIKKSLKERIQELPDVTSLKVIETRGQGKVKVVKLSNGDWQLRVNDQPFFIKGVTYGATEVGTGPHTDPYFYIRWMFSDKNENGRIDAAYDAWVDKNQNAKQDPDEPAVGDFQIMKDMGVNAIRIFPANDPITEYNPDLLNKELLRDMYHKYGISVIVGDFMGAYTIGSGASWEKGTDYTDPEQCRKMKEVIRAKVLDLKDEPFVLMWLLGNENNLPVNFQGVNATRTNAAAFPKEYARFVNDVVEMIHELDGNHPVAIGNLELGLLEEYQKYAPSIDIIGINSYRGSGGFSNLWIEAKQKFDRPIMITEYGCDAYYQERGLDEDGQLDYHRGNLRDIVFHQAGGLYSGNSIGGIIFQYLDEWWKDTQGNPEDVHQTDAQSPFPFPDGYVHEEWFGIIGQGSGEHSPFERRLRKAYYFYKEMWAEDGNKI